MEKPNIWQVMWSVLCAMFGVQSEQNRQRDFQKGNPIAYIIIGVIFVTLFVIILIKVVNLVLP